MYISIKLMRNKNKRKIFKTAFSLKDTLHRAQRGIRMLISQEKIVGASVGTEPHLEDAERKKLQSRIYIKLKKIF